MASKDVQTFTEDDMGDANALVRAPTTNLEDYSFDELMEMSQVHVQDLDELSQAVKEDLIGTPMFILSWEFKQGDYGPDSNFAFVKVRTATGLHWFTDGSTGIRDQLIDYQRKMLIDDTWEKFAAGELGGIRVPRGLLKSEYQWEDENGDKQPGTTFYIDNRDR